MFIGWDLIVSEAFEFQSATALRNSTMIKAAPSNFLEITAQLYSF
jgi:hypothetical protein